MSGTDQASSPGASLPTYAREPGRPGRGPSRGLLALAGVLAGAAGLLVSQAVAAALRATTSPVEAVASTVRDLTPGPLAVFLIHLVGRLDKPLLLGGTAVVVLGLCAYAASWVRRFPLVPDLVFFALAAIGLVSVLRQPSPGVGAALALVVGLVTWIVVLRMLTAPLLDVGGPTDDQRRAFLKRAALTVGVVALVGVAGRVASSGRRNVEAARQLLRLPVRHGVVPVGRHRRRRGRRSLAHAQPGLLHHPHRARAALDLAGGLVAAHPRHGRPRDHADLPGPRRPADDRGLGHAVLRLQPGRRRPDRQRLVVRRADPRPAGGGGGQGRCQRGAADLPRRVELRHPAVGPDRRPRRDARGGDERPAAAGRARLPGADGRARALRLRVGHASGWSTSR